MAADNQSAFFALSFILHGRSYKTTRSITWKLGRVFKKIKFIELQKVCSLFYVFLIF